jgi:type IV pilus assembly protein PilM
MLAVDLGSSSVKIIEFRREGDELVITNFARVDAPAEGNRNEALAECLKRGKFKAKQACAAVSGKAVIVRFLTMPRMPHDELHRAVTFEAEKYIPWPADESQIDAISLGDVPSQDPNSPPEMRVLLVAAKKSFVSDFAQLLIDNNVNPIAIDIDSLAIASAFEMHQKATSQPAAGGAVGLVDIGSGKTTLTIVAGGTPRFMREIDSGGTDMTAAIARRLAVEPFEAERVKCSPGDRASEIEDAIAPAVADLANELNLSFDFFEHQGDGTVESVFLSGGASVAPSIAESIERATSKKVHLWNPMEGLKVHAHGFDVDELNARAASLAVAVGLAAREL